MKKIFFVVLSAAIMAGCNSKKEENKTDNTAGNEKTSGNTDKKPAENTPKPDSATMMKNAQEYMTPGPMQKMLASWAGDWNGEITMWMAPGAPPEKMNVTTNNKSIMNGLYLESNDAGTMMGMPFMGRSIMGYNNHKKVFQSMWIDNFGSGVIMMEGPWDEAAKTITIKGMMTDPSTKAETEMKQVIKIVDDNTQVWEMYVTADGKEFKNMEIKSTRKK